MSMLKAAENAGATIEYRQKFAVGELFISDAWSPPPHEKFAAFMKRTGVVEDMAKDYPKGAWVTMWWIKSGDKAIGVPAGVMTFEPDHDFGLAGKKQMRVNAALDKAVLMMNTLRSEMETLHVH